MKKRTIAIPALLAALSCPHMAKADIQKDNFNSAPANATFLFCRAKTPDANGCKETHSAYQIAIPEPNPLHTGGHPEPATFCTENETFVTSSTNILEYCGHFAVL